ncbi:MAG: AEC family transporter [Planctomycetes bacterium]|nr:AEC family transporter [Planctomycetota bacterium]
MNPAIKVLFFFVDLVLPVFVGYMLVRKSRLRPKSMDWMMTAAIVGVLPFLAWLSCWAIELEMRLIWLPVLGVAMQIVPGTLGFMRSHFKSHNELERGSYVISTILSNRGVVGGLAVFILFGEEAYGYNRLIILLGLPIMLGVWYPLARYFHSSHYESSGQESFLSMFVDKKQIPLLGVGLGFALSAFGVERPEILGLAFQGLVHFIPWMLLLPVGASLDFRAMSEYWRDILDIFPLKFVITPLVLYALGRSVGLEGVPLATVVVTAASPTAINAVITSKLFELNLHLAMTAFVLTTIVYLTVMFPIFLIGSWLLGG